MGASGSVVPTGRHLARDGLQAPVFLGGRHEIDSQSGDDGLAVGLFLPVDGEREESVVLEIHHGEQHVHQSLLQPSLRVLADTAVRVPAMAPVSGQVVGLADGRAAHLDPWLSGFHLVVDGLHYLRDVSAALLEWHLDVPSLGVSYVVEVNAVDVVTLRDLLTELRQIVARLLPFGIHVALGPDSDGQLRLSRTQLPATVGVPLAHRHGDDPGMKLHAASVALLDGEGQGVVARGTAWSSAETAVPRLVAGRIDDGAPDAGLQQDGVDTGRLQPVEDVDKLLLLGRHGLLGLRVAVGPVYTADGREPHRPHFVFSGGRDGVGKEGGLCLAKAEKAAEQRCDGSAHSVWHLY